MFTFRITRACVTRVCLPQAYRSVGLFPLLEEVLRPSGVELLIAEPGIVDSDIWEEN